MQHTTTPLLTNHPPLPTKPPRTTTTQSSSIPQKQKQKPIKSRDLPIKPPKLPTLPKNEFQEKVLYLDSLGLDSLALLNSDPQLLTSPLSNIKSLIDHLTFLNFTPSELQRIFTMCPTILTLNRKDILPVLTFLLTELKLPAYSLKKALNRRPRLLLSDVKTRLRPTLYFLHRIGVEDVSRHSHLLSCSVEDKFLPRIEYFQGIGLERQDVLCMFRRFPQLFCYSVEGNFVPKVEFLLDGMGRELAELREFPQYFSFSLEERIRPRHEMCVERGVVFPLKVLLKSSEGRFRDRLEACRSSSMPVRGSPLWSANCDLD